MHMYARNVCYLLQLCTMFRTQLLIEQNMVYNEKISIPHSIQVESCSKKYLCRGCCEKGVPLCATLPCKELQPAHALSCGCLPVLERAYNPLVVSTADI